MTWKNYWITCAVTVVVVALALTFIPGLSDTVEQLMLLFLSTNAR